MKQKKILSLLLAMALVAVMTVLPAFAASNSFPDVEDHWSKAAVDRWTGYGIFTGDPDGNFYPDKAMTRAEFAAMLSRLMGYTDMAAEPFTDVAATDWYYEPIMKLAAAGVMEGWNGMATPESLITREEAAVLLCRAMGLKPSADAKMEFADAAAVSSWAQDAVAALAERGMVQGMGDNKYEPALNINKASVATMVSNMVVAYVDDELAENDVKGDLDGVVIIATDKPVTFTDAAITGPVVVAPAAGEQAEVTLGKGTTADSVTVAAPGAAVTVAKGAQVKAVDVAAKDADITVAGKVDAIAVADTAADAALSVEKGATVGAVTADAATAIENKGTIDALENNAEGTKVTGTPAKTETGTEKVENTKPSSSGSSGSSSSGGGSDTPAPAPADVVKAPLFDQRQNAENAAEGTYVPAEKLAQNYTVTGTAAANDADGKPVYNVTIAADHVMKHKNAGSPASTNYWVGFGIPAETGNKHFYLDSNGAEQALTSADGRTFEAENGKTYTSIYLNEEDKTTTIIVKDSTNAKVATYKVTNNSKPAPVVENVTVKMVTDEATYNSNLPSEYTAAYPWSAGYAADLPWMVVTYDRNVAGVTYSVTKNGTALTVPNDRKDSPETIGTGKYQMWALGSNLGVTDALSGNYEITLTEKNGTDAVSASIDYKHAGETTYTVTFDSQGGSAVDPQTVVSGKPATQPTAPTKAGYTFDGWFKGEATTSFDFSSTNITEDTTLTAKWTPVSYTITYNQNGGTAGANAPANYTVETATLTIPDSTKEGYTFGGWYTDTQCTQAFTYTQGTTTGNLTLYAKWTANKYTITYHLNDGALAEGVTNPAEYTAETENLTLTAPTKTGYTFDKWYTDSACTTEFKYQKGTTTGNLDLYAGWTAIPYTVIFGEAESTVTETWTVEGKQGETDVKELTLTEREGMKAPAGYEYDYDTAPWYYMKNGTEAVSLEKATQIAAADLPTYAYEDSGTWKIRLCPTPRMVATIAIPTESEISKVLTGDWAKGLEGNTSKIIVQIARDESHETTWNASGTITAFAWEGFDSAYKEKDRWYIVFTIAKPEGVETEGVVVRAGIDENAPAWSIEMTDFSDDNGTKVYIPMLVGDVESNTKATQVTIQVNWNGFTENTTVDDYEQYVIDLTKVTFATAETTGGNTPTE